MVVRSVVRTAALRLAVSVVVVSVVPANAVTSTRTWSNSPFAAQSDPFVIQFDSVPNAANMDGVTALSATAATSYSDGAVLVRFNPAGQIDARNGAVYAPSSIPYQAGTMYRFRLVVDVPSKTYSAYVTPQGGTELTLGTGLAFRSEQATCASLGNLGVVAYPGSHDVTNLGISPTVAVSAGEDQAVTLPAAATLAGMVTVNGREQIPAGAVITWNKVSGPGTVSFGNPYAQETTATFSVSGTYQLQLAASYNGQTASDTLTILVTPPGQTSTTTWKNTSFAAQAGPFTAEFDATPNADNMDGVTMLSSSAATSFASGAVIVRFNPEGMIDARSGSSYLSNSVPYTAGKTYHFRLVVNVVGKTYSVYVTPQGGTELTVGTDYAFRTEQASCASLANWAMIANPGTHTVNNFKVTAQAAPSGKTSSTTWQNTSFTTQTGAFTAEFDATPNAYGMDGVTMLSSSAVSSYASGAVIVRFNSQGQIDARNGDAYTASTISYTPGLKYHFRLEVNVPGKTYSAYVTPQGGSEQTIGTNLAFRSEQAACDRLANWAMIANPGTHTVDNFKVVAKALPLSASAGSNQSITAGQSCTLAGSASGGTAPYAYSWSPTTGLSSPTSATTTASPISTQIYTLTVRDAAGQTATDSITVTVSAVATNVYYVATNGNDANPGTAAAPWRTLAKAASVVTAGSTVIVKPGTYYETLRLTQSGAAGKLITFKSETPRGAVIDGQSSRTNGVNIDGRQYIRIEGFEIRYHSGNAIQSQSYYGTTAQGQEIVNNYIHHNGNYTSWGGTGVGMYASNLRDSLIEDNEFYYNGDSAIIINGSGFQQANLTIRGNSIHYNGRDGITGGGTNIIVEYNHLYDQEHTALHQDGIELWTVNGVIVRYNILGDFTQMVYGGMLAGKPWVNLQVYGNVFYNALRWQRRGYNVAAVWVDCRNATVSNPLTGIQIHSNTFLFLGTWQSPIQLQGSSILTMDDVRIYNNIFYQCGGSGGANAYSIDSRFTNVRADYNCFYNVYRNLAGQDAHSITADPMLVNYTLTSVPVDVRLRAGSPCINAGAANLGDLVTLPKPFVDRNKVARPTGGNYDIGAFEQ